MVGDVTLRGKREVHRNHAAERSRAHSSRGNILLGLPENHFTRGAAVARARDDFTSAGEAQVDAVRSLRFELQMNPSADAVARGKRQRIEFEIGIAEAPVTNRRANCVCEEDHANQAEAEKQEGAWITAVHHLRCKPSDHREQDHVTENADHPVCDFSLLVQAFCTAAGPVRAPQPRGEWIPLFDRSLLLQASVAANRCVHQPCSDCGKDQTEHDAENRVARLEICPAYDLCVDEKESGTRKREPKESEEESSAFGRLGHALILESQGVNKTHVK